MKDYKWFDDETKLRLLSNFCYGALAQLVERLHGMQEVSGSTPLCSTI